MKTLIAIPAMDMMPTSFVSSYTNMRPVGECEQTIVSGSLVYDSRNKIAEWAVKYGFDYVFWLDSDMIFEPDLMQRMFDSIGDADLLSGLYFSRGQVIKPVIWKKCRASVIDGAVHPETEYYWDYPQETKVEIEACGFGCVLMKTQLLKDVYDKFGLPFSPAYGFGEDLSFCMRALQLGAKMYCDTSIRLGHEKRIESNEQLYMSQRTEMSKRLGAQDGSPASDLPKEA